MSNHMPLGLRGEPAPVAKHCTVVAGSSGSRPPNGAPTGAVQDKAFA